MLDTQILLVDLNATWSHATAAALSKAGYTVQTAVSFQDALQRMTQYRLPDLMVLSLPHNNPEYAFTFCKNVQTFSDLPVVLVADRRDPALFARALNVYAEDSVVESVSPGIMVAPVLLASPTNP